MGKKSECFGLVRNESPFDCKSEIAIVRSSPFERSIRILAQYTQDLGTLMIHEASKIHRTLDLLIVCSVSFHDIAKCANNTQIQTPCFIIRANFCFVISFVTV